RKPGTAHGTAAASWLTARYWQARPTAVCRSAHRLPGTAHRYSYSGAVLAILHGLIAASDLKLLLFVAFTIDILAYAISALILLLTAATDGVFLNLPYQEKAPLSESVMYIHALTPVASFILLIIVAVT